MKLIKEEVFIQKLLFNNSKVDRNEIKNLNSEKLVKISSSHLIIPLIFFKIKKLKLSKKFDKNLIDYFEEIFELNYSRNTVLMQEIHFIKNLLKSKKIKFSFIKGASFLDFGLYENIGERMIGDIDLISENNEAYLELLYNGYKRNSDYNFFLDKRKHYPRIINEDKLFAVEVHKRFFDKEINFINKSNIINMQNKFLNQKDNFLTSSFFINSLNHQINDFGNLFLSYNYRNLYDSYLIIKRLKKISSNEIFSNNYIKNYIFVCNKLGLNFIKNESQNVNSLLRFRFFLKYNYKLINKLDYFFVSFLKKIKYIPSGFSQLLKNKEYRKYILKKLLNFS